MLHIGMVDETTTDHDRSFLTDVLWLANEETEEQMDSKLHNEAKELGIEMDTLFFNLNKPQSTFSSEAPRRSESIDSRASQSTGLTSNFSEFSRDHQYGQGSQLSRPSLSFRDYDKFIARGRPNGRHSISFSPPTTPARSTFSLPLSSPSSSPKKHFRRIRGLSLLRLSRVGSSSLDADGCPHCPQNISSQRRAVHKLPCGHTLCTQALRDTICGATASKAGAVPSCCGLPVPGALMELVMTTKEQTELLDKLEQWDEAASIAFSTISETKEPPPIRGPGIISRTISTESRIDSMAPRMRKDKELFHDTPKGRQLQKEQSELLERFVVWTDKQRTELKSIHDQLRKEMILHHESAIEDLLEHHGIAMAEAEDKQVKAEANMRETQAQEKRDNATALKHMEAYCAGTYSTGEPHHRVVTEQDRAELEKTRRTRDDMDAKHSSAINILRGDQGRRMKLRAQRQEKEDHELRLAQVEEGKDLATACTTENRRFDEKVSEKGNRMRMRNDLQSAIMAKSSSNQAEAALKKTFSQVEWQDETREAVLGAANVTT